MQDHMVYLMRYERTQVKELNRMYQEYHFIGGSLGHGVNVRAPIQF